MNFQASWIKRSKTIGSTKSRLYCLISIKLISKFDCSKHLKSSLYVFLSINVRILLFYSLIDSRADSRSPETIPHAFEPMPASPGKAVKRLRPQNPLDGSSERVVSSERSVNPVARPSRREGAQHCNERLKGEGSRDFA
ncbi:MAG: hypothetical protein NUW37_08660, partial [Planctomycetes bacterium]|nr:hypothetical protein [Planctomycetota bacterium]